MRRYTDPDGRVWDVVLGRESFGALYAIFVAAADNPGRPRQTLLRADATAGAFGELDAMSDDEMNELFERSEPKELG